MGNQTSLTQIRTLYDGYGNIMGTETLFTEYQYDLESRLTKTIHPNGASSETVYNAAGQVVRQTDPLGRAIEHSYDARGNRVRTDYSDGSHVVWAYDAEGRQLTVTHYSSSSVILQTSSFAYDANGRRTTAIHADGSLEHTTYDALGRIIAQTDARGNITSYEYQPGAVSRRSVIADALGNITTFAYDASGNQTAITNANDHTTAFEYDAQNRPTRTINADGTFTETEYDSLGRRSAVVDELGQRTEYAYDGLGRLVAIHQPHPDTPGQTISTSYAYDESGNQIAQTDALGRATRYTYDSMGRRLSRTLPGGETEAYVYDIAGRLIAKTDFNGHTTTYAYDSRDRLIQITADPGHPSLSLPHATASKEFSYDALGRRIFALARNANGDIIHHIDAMYDNRSRLVQATTPYGVLAYSYDAAGNLTGVASDNENGIELAYAYDALNRLQTVYDHGAQQPPLEHHYTYNAVGSLQSMTYALSTSSGQANGITHTYTFNSLNRLTDLAISHQSSTITAFSYQLNALGHRTRQTESSGRTVDYTYDHLQRLTSEMITDDPYAINGASNWTYDLVGNRLTQSSTLPGIHPRTDAYSANDRLNSHSYDANGNTVSSAIRHSPSGIAPEPQTANDVYDFMNRLIRRTTATSDVIDITYSADGDRIAKTVNGLAVYYLVDRNNLTGYAQVVEELRLDHTGTLTTVRTYTYGHDLIAQHQLLPPSDLEAYLAGQGGASPVWHTHYYLYDGLGSVRGLADEMGLVTDAYTYDAWGNLLHAAGQGTPNLYLFTGEQWDNDLGMYFLRARYLNPATGRFHTQDPFEGFLSDPQSLHKYLYAHANPVMFVDPSGMFRLAEIAMGMMIYTNNIQRFQIRSAIAAGTAAIDLVVFARFYAPITLSLMYVSMDPMGVLNSNEKAAFEYFSIMAQEKSQNLLIRTSYRFASIHLGLIGSAVFSSVVGVFTTEDWRTLIPVVGTFLEINEALKFATILDRQLSVISGDPIRIDQTMNLSTLVSIARSLDQKILQAYDKITIERVGR